MSYNNNRVPLSTAGKITIFTTLFGVVAFLFIFLLNIGQSEFTVAQAQSNATTSVNVLNTPPSWDTVPQELTESSTTTPTNSGDAVTWVGTATDSNGQPYFLLVCSTNATPTANANGGTAGTAPPDCGGGAILWAVSTGTVSGTEASAATTTTEAFSESNDWYAWACDDDAVYPQCILVAEQGSGTTSSPFNVNHRPTFTAVSDDSPADPGAVVTFEATAADADSVDSNDTMQLHICSAADFGTGTSTTECGPGGTLATSTFTAATPTATYTIASVAQDTNYTAFAYIVDEHGHTASGGAQGTDSVLTVSNVAPTINGALIDLNGGSDITLSVEAGETTGFTLDFTVNDANSCEAVGPTPEITNYVASVYRSGVGTTSCDASGEYDPNDCYTNTVATTTWNLSCSATTTGSGACTGATDATVDWECTFPLWYVADPTDGVNASTSVYFAEDWRAAISAVDDDNATSTFTESTITDIDVVGLLAFALDTLAIPYGDLAPGDDTGTLSATTTARATGNVGVDHDLSGLRMCPTGFAPGACAASATSSIIETNQEYGTSSLAYGSGTDLTTTDTTLDINIQKSTSTVTQASGVTYWGIGVPGTVTLAGIYTGQNTFTAVQSDSSQW